MNTYRIVCLLLLIFCLFSCKNDSKTGAAPSLKKSALVQSDTSGGGTVRYIDIQAGAKTYKVFTKKVGENPTAKVLLLHGGPAMTTEYMECFSEYLPAAGYELYYYHQLGSHLSDQPEDDALWELDRFVEEVEQVRIALGLDKDNFYIIGNSWGGILGLQYALKYQQHLKGLVVSNMQGSFPAYAAYNATLRAKMRPGLIDSLTRFEEKGDYTNPEYVDLVTEEYYRKHVCRMKPFPDGFQRAMDHLNVDIYNLMQGPSEFVPGGRLAEWDVMDDLEKITVPTLMIGATYDTMDPKAMEKMATLVKNGRYLHCPNGSHLAMWDDQEHYFSGVLKFLNQVETGDFLETLKVLIR